MPNKTPSSGGVRGTRASGGAVGEHAAQVVHELGDFVGGEAAQVMIERAGDIGGDFAGLGLAQFGEFDLDHAAVMAPVSMPLSRASSAGVSARPRNTMAMGRHCMAVRSSGAISWSSIRFREL